MTAGQLRKIELNIPHLSGGIARIDAVPPHKIARSKRWRSSPEVVRHSLPSKIIRLGALIVAACTETAWRFQKISSVTADRAVSDFVVVIIKWLRLRRLSERGSQVRLLCFVLARSSEIATNPTVHAL